MQYYFMSMSMSMCLLRLWKHLGSVSVNQCVNLDSMTVEVEQPGKNPWWLSPFADGLSSSGSGKYISIVMFGIVFKSHVQLQVPLLLL